MEKLVVMVSIVILTLRIFKHNCCQGFSLLELLIVLLILSTFIGSINFFVLKPYKLEELAVNVATQLRSAQNISKYQNKIISFNLNSEKLTFMCLMNYLETGTKNNQRIWAKNLDLKNQVKTNVYVSKSNNREKIIINNNPINENILIELIGKSV